MRRMNRPGMLLLVSTQMLLACGDAPVEPPSESGAIEVNSTTVGDGTDPDGYRLTIDGGSDTAIGPNSTLTLSEVSPGEHRLELGGIAPNCAATGPNPRTVAVSRGSTARVGFEVECTSSRGSLGVTTRTSGGSLDPDGYQVALDEETAVPIAANGTTTFTGVAAGDHQVHLTGVAANCAVGGANPRTVAVTNGGSSQVSFEVSCLPTGSGTILFISDRSGTSHLYRMQADGSEIVDLTPSADAFDGDWSPDGSRIVFTATDGQENGIFVMDADGSNPASLGVQGESPSWSPDGRRILFTSGGSFTIDASIQVMDADGSGVTALTTGRSPDWSPDGASIAFWRIGQCVSDFCSSDIYLMAADGTRIRRLTTSTNLSDLSTGPAWSPDGTRIAYTRRCCFLGADLSGVWVVSPEGGRPDRLDARAAGSVVWSPDGSALAFSEGQPGGSELVVIPSGGGAGMVLASSPAAEYPVSWK